MDITEKRIDLLHDIYRALSRDQDLDLAEKYNYDFECLNEFWMLRYRMDEKIRKDDLKILNKVWNSYKNLSAVDLQESKHGNRALIALKTLNNEY